MQQFNNEVLDLKASSEQMRELTLDEVQMVAGGDAAATHTCTQNSWGEEIDGANPFCKLL